MVISFDQGSCNTPDKKVDALLINTLNDLVTRDSSLIMQRLALHIKNVYGITIYTIELEQAFQRAAEEVRVKPK